MNDEDAASCAHPSLSVRDDVGWLLPPLHGAMIVMPGALLLLIITLGSQGRQEEGVAVDDEDDENDGGG